MSFSKKISEEVKAIRALSPHVNLYDKRIAEKNLALMHQVIIASENLLQEAIKCIGIPVTAFEHMFLTYLQRHLFEEAGHAEWLADDVPIGGALSANAIALPATQYYLINHVHPVAILGYMAVLENNPMSFGLLEELEALHGEKMYRTLRYHITHDAEHLSDLSAVLDAAPEALQPIMMDSAMHAAMCMNSISEELRG